MKIYTKILILSAIAFFLTACGGGNNDASSQFSDNEKSFLHNLFLTEYLWYDQVDRDISYKQYSDAKSMTRALRVTPPDRWSFSMTKSEYNDYASQKTAGFGFGYTSTDFRVYRVLIDSPVYGKLKRGDKILQVNGTDVNNTVLSDTSHNLGVAAEFTLLRDGNQITISLTPREYSFKVSLAKIINRAGKKIGYLRYDSFTDASIDEIESAFTKFHDAGVDELVIDLRYNGGGSINTASVLLDNITDAYLGKRQVYLDWNSNYTRFDSTYYFDDEKDGNELTMKRVFFLTTKNSASASELVISALKPYLGDANVITIGDNTHGKPVGMSGRTYGNDYFFIINFFIRNNNGDTTSFDGIPVTCSADDDLSHAMGEENESMLASALYYIEHSTCQ